MNVTSCADNTSVKNPATMTVKDIRGRLDRILATGSDVMCRCSVKEGKLVLRKKEMFVEVISRRKPRNRKEPIFIYFEDNGGMIVNMMGEMKGSAITRPASQEHLGCVRNLHEGKTVLLDILTKYNDPNYVDTRTWCGRRKFTMNLMALKFTNFLKRNDVQRMKLTLSRLNTKHVEGRTGCVGVPKDDQSALERSNALRAT